jgi:CheY-like chemotaxis protein
MNSGSGILRGRRILVVEDEAIETLLIEDLLSSAGAIVIGPTGTIGEALALIEQEDIHCGHIGREAH